MKLNRLSIFYMTINKGLSKDYRNNLIILLFIAVSVISVYWQVINFDFIYYDDPKYVRFNPVINKGITGGAFNGHYFPRLCFQLAPPDLDLTCSMLKSLA